MVATCPGTHLIRTETRALLTALLDAAGNELVSKLKEGVAAGNLAFGAAVVTKADLQPVTVSVNKVKEWPLLHGETNCLREFWQITTAESRPAPKDCVFFATHEPCPLCLSGITWTGFKILICLFSYEETRDRFAINDDIDVIESIFRVPAPGDTAETLKAPTLQQGQQVLLLQVDC
jgi:tRNA(Arg) A34 adenosine deaminase TadA